MMITDHHRFTPDTNCQYLIEPDTLVPKTLLCHSYINASFNENDARNAPFCWCWERRSSLSRPFFTGIRPPLDQASFDDVENKVDDQNEYGKTDDVYEHASGSGNLNICSDGFIDTPVATAPLIC